LHPGCGSYGELANMTSTSILSALKKIDSLLTREDKVQGLKIAGFAICTSMLEIITASVIIVFAQVLNQPEIGQNYLSKLGLSDNLSTAQIILYIAIIVGATYLVKNIIACLEVFYQNKKIQDMNYNFKNKLLNRYAAADYGFYLTRNSSLGLQVVGGDAEQMFTGGMIALASIISESVIFICLIALIVYMNPVLALVIFAIGAITALIVTKYLFPKFYSWGQRLQIASTHSNQNLLQFFHAFKEIVLLGKREYFVDAYQGYSREKADVQAKQTATNSMPRMVIETLFVFMFVLTVAILCFEHETPVQMLGILGGYMYAGFRLMPGLNRIVNQLNTFKYVIPTIERVHKEYNTVGANENYVDNPDFDFQMSININNLSFNYLNTAKESLVDVCLEISKGQCLGIVGETGSGKSTLVDLILGLLKPSNGSILVDGRFPVRTLQWHQKIGYVPQSIYLTDDTIEANIAFGEKEINIQRLNDAIDAAQLRKFIDQLPQLAKTVVGERGIRLSGGERQRIAIARALYRNPEVLIFDEATSALDNDTEERLMETIHAISKNRTVIMIAHRLSTLKGCDKIVSLGNGRVQNVSTYAQMGVK
jgi:ABC-type multidrug transport system fused ATPase/permease subunit